MLELVVAVAWCEDYINTDDPVPTTSETLMQGYNFDINNSKLRNNFMSNEDSWPDVYLAKVWEAEVDQNAKFIFLCEKYL